MSAREDLNGLRAKAGQSGYTNSERVKQIAQAALACFMSAGYRLTQVSHVTERMGVSTGFVYRYVESKEALFHLAALEAAGRLPDDPSLPVKVSGISKTVAVLREVVDQDRAWLVLETALAAPEPADLRAEVEAVAGELYEAVSARVELIWLLDRCAHEMPALAEIFDDGIRNRYMDDLVAWIIRRRLVNGPPAQAAALARGVMEAVTWLARNRRSDRTASEITETEARNAAVRIFANAFDYEAGRQSR